MLGELLIKSGMEKKALKKIAQELVSAEKGILAADESLPTIKKRFAVVGIESTPDTRRAYRELLFTTPQIEKFLSGVIMFDETVYQKTGGGIPFPKLLEKRGIIPGIKVDEGREPYAPSSREMVTKGLKNLSKRLSGYLSLGLKFTKWRAVFLIGDKLPTKGLVLENAKRLAEFAKISQEKGFVPIVEPEVLREGSHNLAKCEEVSTVVFSTVFSELERKGVYLPGILLKPNMVTAGKEAAEKASPPKVARATLKVLAKTVPEEVPGIVFLSGGQTPDEATANLNAINLLGKKPWELSFSFGRALQSEALGAWRGRRENVRRAQRLFLKRARLVSLARQGRM